MPRYRGKSKGNKDTTETSSSKKNPDLSVNDLIKEADVLIDKFNYDEAVPKLRDVLNIDVDNIKAMEMLAGVYIEQCKVEEAQQLWKNCIELSPDSGYLKYFSMAQTTESEESLKLYQKGIEVLDKQLENSENIIPETEISKESLKRALSDAYCSVAEIFMTDCCFQEDAEQMCLKSIEAAIQSDQTNPEAYKCMADFRIVKEEPEDAKEAIQKSLSLWLPSYRALRDGETPPGGAENLIPEYDSRFQTAKTLTELELFDEANEILDGLIEEDDEDVEVWYVLGMTNYVQGDEHKANAHYYFNKAKQVSIKTGEGDLECVAHIDELIAELKDAYPLEEEDAADDKDDDESDWTTESESEEKMDT